MQYIQAVFTKIYNGFVFWKNNYHYDSLASFAEKFPEELGNDYHEGVGYELYINLKNPILLTCLWVGDGFLNCFTGEVTLYDELEDDQILLRRYKSVLRAVIIDKDCPLPDFVIRSIARECQVYHVGFNNLKEDDQSD